MPCIVEVNLYRAVPEPFLWVHFSVPGFYTKQLILEFRSMLYLVQAVKEESEKVGLKLNILKTKIMGNRWGNSGSSVRAYFFGSKITADGDCSHEIKRCLLLGRKVMTNLDIMLKSRDITLPTKVRLVKAMVFPEVMYGCESWTVKKAEH